MDTQTQPPSVSPRRPLPSTRQVVRDIAANITLVVLAGVLTGLAFPPFEYWPLAFFCLIPLLIALRRTVAVRAAAWLALLYGLVVCAVALQWMQSIFGAGAIGIYIIVTLP